MEISKYKALERKLKEKATEKTVYQFIQDLPPDKCLITAQVNNEGETFLLKSGGFRGLLIGKEKAEEVISMLLSLLRPMPINLSDCFDEDEMELINEFR